MEDILAIEWIKEMKWRDASNGNFGGVLFCHVILAKFTGNWK